MLKNKDIVCISSIDWDFIWQGHQEIMSTLADNGNRVLFIENTGVRSPGIKDFPRLWKRFLNWKKGYKGLRKERENLYIYSPLVLPFPYSAIARRINRIIMLSVIKRWMRVLEFHNPVVWSFLPTALVLDLLNELEPSIFIYYCIDDFASSSKEAKKITKIEEKVIQKADLVFATSRKLYERCKLFNREVYRFPFGVSVNNYNTTRENSTDIPEDMRGIRKPIIGYVGGIHKWVDIKLLRDIAVNREDVSIVLIGPKQTDLFALDGTKNVHTLGKKPKEDLPKYVKFFDVGIIPYLKTSYTENVYPTKINEYLAMGKAVISTRIPEVVEFDREMGGNFINFIETEKDFDKTINQILKREDNNVVQKRIEVANSNSWDARTEKMCNLIDSKLAETKQDVDKDWMKRLKTFYVRSRAKTIKFAALILVLYFTVFYSPVVWWLAEPLKISQSPKIADAIVVFGGGVGEDGSPGKSTIERARFSTDLYKKGFAKHIIYSSGYIYEHNDAENMKLFAMSMGIPEENIILEKKANSAYENVKFTTDILRKKGFDKILLVSSPYNMKRSSLIYDNIADDIEVRYTPVPNPQFYYRHKKIGLEQIKAIIHEYAAIIYYYFKNYI